jgi:hypothetical protein
MNKEASIAIGGGLIMAAAVGLTAVYVINKNNCSERELNLETVEAKSFFSRILELLKTFATDLIESIYKKIRDYLVEVIFKTKMTAHDQKVN